MIITRNFPPLIGGMERLVWNIYSELNKHYSCWIVGPQGCRDYVSPRESGYECNMFNIVTFLTTAQLQSIRASINRRPHLCIAGSGVTAPIAAIIGATFKVPTVTFVHGLDLVAESRIYQALFVPAIRKSTVVIANSHNTAQLAQAKAVNPEKIQVLFPGVDTDGHPNGGEQFRKKYKLEGKKILLSVGRIIPRKGLAHFVRHSLPGILEKHPDTVLAVIGEEASSALKQDRHPMQDLIKVIDELQLEPNVRILGKVDDETLVAAYKESDLHVFPLREVPGDVEGFGMVVIEAAARGLPTAAFAVGGVTDAITDRKSGFLVQPGKYAELSRTIIDYLDGKKTGVDSEQCIKHAGAFSWDRFGDQLHQLCHELLATRNK